MLLLKPTTLPDGRRVRLRLPHASDRAGLRALHASVGLDLDDVALNRMVRLDPRREVTVVATAWVGGQETVVGFASGVLGHEAERIIVNEVVDPELVGLLVRALSERTAAVRRVA